jgi:predicted ATPase
VERCFEVLEKVLIPYHRRSNRLRRERDLNPNSPLSLDVAPEDRRPLEKPLVGKARSEATKTSRYHRRAADALNREHEDDLAYHLHVLHSISPMWNTWQPRHDVLRRLFDTIMRLRAGHPADAESPDRDELSMNPDVLRQRNEDAAARLYAIHEAYPDAVQLVEKFERQERRRLGRWFRKVYSWAAGR